MVYDVEVIIVNNKIEIKHVFINAVWFIHKYIGNKLIHIHSHIENRQQSMKI